MSTKLMIVADIALFKIYSWLKCRYT